MKTTKILTAALIALAMLFGFAGCSDNPVDDPVINEIDYPAFELSVIDLHMGELTEATIENEMAIRSVSPADDVYDFSYIIKAMGLDQSQVDEFKTLLNEHNDFVADVYGSIRNTEEAIVKGMNMDRDMIVGKFESGILDRETAQVQIGFLNNEAREWIGNKIDFDRYEREVFGSRHDFIGKVTGILNEEQQAMWREFTHAREDIFFGPVH